MYLLRWQEISILSKCIISAILFLVLYYGPLIPLGDVSLRLSTFSIESDRRVAAIAPLRVTSELIYIRYDMRENSATTRQRLRGNSFYSGIKCWKFKSLFHLRQPADRKFVFLPSRTSFLFLSLPLYPSSCFDPFSATGLTGEHDLCETLHLFLYYCC